MKKVLAAFLGVIGIVVAIIGFLSKVKEDKSVTIIGGADGPTSIFVAGKTNSECSIWFIVIGILLIITSIFFLLKKHR